MRVVEHEMSDPTSNAETRGASIALAAEIASHLVSHMIAPAELIAILDRAGVRFVLTGAYALGVWTDAPRATMDVDALVDQTDHDKAVAAVLADYPALQVEETEVVTRFRSPASGKVVIDLMRPGGAFLEAVFANATRATVDGQDVLIPELEMAAAMKFAAMVSPWRELSKKYIDAGDFIAIVRRHPGLDREKLAALAELLYSDAGDEVRRLADDAVAGRRLTF